MQQSKSSSADADGTAPPLVTWLVTALILFVTVTAFLLLHVSGFNVLKLLA